MLLIASRVTRKKSITPISLRIQVDYTILCVCVCMLMYACTCEQYIIINFAIFIIFNKSFEARRLGIAILVETRDLSILWVYRYDILYMFVCIHMCVCALHG